MPMWQNAPLRFLSPHNSRLFSQILKNRDITLKAVTSLQLYKAKFNTTKVPQSFQVPTDDSTWPREMWGEKIGRRIDICRNLFFKDLLSSHDIQLLEQNGMQWEVRPITLKNVQRIAHALRQYKVNYGSTSIIPLDFKIPLEEGNWLNSQRGMALGYGVQRLRTKYFQNHLEKEYVDILSSAGLFWNEINSKTVLNLIKAMGIYQKLHGTTAIPLNFVVREAERHQWPVAFHHINIGELVAKVRAAYREKTLNTREVSALEKAGIQWVDPSRKYFYTWVSRLVRGLEVYKKLHGSTLVPQNFIVPSNIKENWPEDLHGYKLGMGLSNARYQYKIGSLKQKDIKALDEVGVNWVINNNNTRN